MEETTFSQEKGKSIDLLCSMRQLGTYYEILKEVRQEKESKWAEEEFTKGWFTALQLMENSIEYKISQLKKKEIPTSEIIKGNID